MEGVREQITLGRVGGDRETVIEVLNAEVEVSRGEPLGLCEIGLQRLEAFVWRG